MYVVLEGTVEILIEREGEALCIDTGGPGGVYGEIGFSGGDVARTASVRATSAVTAVRLDASRTQRGLRFYPGIAIRLYRNISSVLGARLRDSHQRLLRASGGR
jgi:CRP-like cAMP-binding protein